MSITQSAPSTSVALAEQLAAIANRHGLACFAETMVSDAAQVPLTVAFLGEFSTGKTSLINALLGQSLLPTMEQPTTAAIVEVAAGPALRARCETAGTWDEVSLSELGHYVMGAGALTVNKVVLEVPNNPFVTDGMCLVDTPGISSLEQTHADITHGYLPHIDAAFVVLDVNKGCAPDSLLRFLTEQVAAQGLLSRFYFLVNRADTMTNEAAQKVLEEIRAQLTVVIPHPRVHLVSAQLALRGETERSGIQAIHAALDELRAQRCRIAEDRLVAKLKDRAGELRSLLRVQGDSLSVDTQALEQQMAKVRRGQEHYEQERNKLRAEFERVRETTQTAARSVITRHVDQVMSSAYAGNAAKLEGAAKAMAADLIAEVEPALQRLDLGLDFKSEGLSAELDSRIRGITEDVRGFIDLISPILTGVAIAAVTGPAVAAGAAGAAGAGAAGAASAATASAAAATVAVEAAEVVQATAGVILAKTFAKETLEKLDIVGAALKWGAKKWQEDEVSRLLKHAIGSRLAMLLQEVELRVESVMAERYGQPLAELAEALRAGQEQRKQAADDVLAAKARIQDDLDVLTRLIKRGD